MCIEKRPYTLYGRLATLHFRYLTCLLDRGHIRERLHFYFFEGMTYRQIAAKEGVGEKNIRESINGAVKKIKKYFD